MTRISVSNLFFGCVVVSYSLGVTCDGASTLPSVPPKPRSAQAYTFTYMQWQALPCVPKPQQLPHTDSASQEAVEANADSQHTSNSHLDCGCVTLVAKETFEGKRQAM
nr:uncharacterized protein LOC129380852 [Dermacentor andersoni]